ncbi:hypothetical protein CN157_09200 [Sinorhizobium meliloti]|uniref:hypothetical protein n=1 Tax=Rhizobium meliloti TaxID=382 RepID=UPI000FDBC84B|nr:hypothetical protein [Sinorhizobium meliloti]RVK79357.1 hypothetical protein CN157_09200 [Sinorhizobium meliloti]RVQ66626.1 hypothetical protein CN061_32615 [Sinorhizobium meliloti]
MTEEELSSAIDELLRPLAGETVPIVIRRSGTVYKPDWAEEGERLAYFNGEERMQHAARTCDLDQYYLIRDIWIIDDNDELVGLKTCEYGIKGEDGKGTIWKPCRQGVNFADIEPYEVVELPPPPKPKEWIIPNMVPAEASTVAETPEFSAWASEDVAWVVLDMASTNNATLNAAIDQIRNAGYEPQRVHSGVNIPNEGVMTRGTLYFRKDKAA